MKWVEVIRLKFHFWVLLMTKIVDWTPDKKQFIFDNYYHRPYKELTDMFNKEFGLNVSFTIIKCFLKRNGLKNGLDGRFYKGQPSHNKGKKMPPEVYEKVKHTMFKKGCKPPTHVEVGTEILLDDGYVKIKVAEPNVWKQKQRFVWENAYGPVPDNMMLMFLDGDRTNCELSNLKLIRKDARLIMNKNKMIYNDVVLNETASNLATLMAKEFEVKRKRKERENGNDKS